MTKCVDRCPKASYNGVIGNFSQKQTEALLASAINFKLSVQAAEANRMSMMIAMDLQAALIAHLHWKSRLADFFYGLEEIKESDVSDHTNCEFGKWFYARGKNELAAWPELDDVEQCHKEVHQYIRELVIMPEEIRHSPEGRRQLARFQETCDRLVALLEAMEKKAQPRSAS